MGFPVTEHIYLIIYFRTDCQVIKKTNGINTMRSD